MSSYLHHLEGDYHEAIRRSERGSDGGDRIGMTECEGNVPGHGVQMPAIEAEGAFEDPFKMPNLAEVKAAHIRLMRAYMSVIAACSFIERPQGNPWPIGSLLPLLVRRLVGGHIRRRLIELGTIYLQLRQATYDEGTQSVDPWLSETSKGCMEVAKRLPKWSLPSIAIIISIALPVLGLLSKIHGSGIAVALLLGWVVLIWLIFIFLWVSFVPGRKAYLKKRELFLPGASNIDKAGTDKQDQRIAHNVYWLENELYKTLQRKKKNERQVDQLLFLWTFVITLELTIGLTIQFLPLYWLIADWVFIVIFGWALGNWLLRKREWL